MDTRSKEFLVMLILFVSRTMVAKNVAILWLWSRVVETQKNSPQSYSLIDRIPSRAHYIGRLTGNSRAACLENIRINAYGFQRLCALLVEGGGLTETRWVSVPEMVTAFLGILGHSKKQRVQKFDFHRSTRTISKNFYKVLRSLIRLKDVLIAKPVPITGVTRFNYFENCLGALDGTYIPVNVKQIDQARYRNQKGFISTNVLGVCNENMKFIYLLAGWEGSAADGHVIRGALQRDFRVWKGNYYLADSGYTNTEGFLTPYRGFWYHLKTWRGNNRQPQNAQELFNMTHAKTRNVIERAWGLIKFL